MASFMADLGARLVDNGYAVIPIMPGTKKPGRFVAGAWRDYPGWTKHCQRPTTENELAVWSQWPDAGIGIAGGVVAAVDIDIADGELAVRIETLARERLGETPALRIGRAPKRLLVYRTDAPFKGFKLMPIEVLCEGQQFVAYHIHPDTGRPYEWPEESLADIDIGRLPLISEAQARAFAEEAYALLPETLRPARLGGGNVPAHPAAPGDLRGTTEAVSAALAFIPNADLDYESWMRIGMALKGALGDEAESLFAVWSAQSAKDVPDYTAKAWASFQPRSIGAGTLYHHAIANGWTPEPDLVLNGNVHMNGHHPAKALLEKLQPAAAAEPPAMPVPPIPDLARLDGALALFVSYILTTAIRPQPWLAVGAALTALGTLMGRNYRTETNLRSNLYVIGLAVSGGGKDHARNAIKEAFLAADLATYLGGNRIVSGAGLLTALYRQPASLFQIDEFGQFLASIIDKRRAPKHLAEIWDLLTELSTSAGSTFFGAEYADQHLKPRQDIIQPCCGIHATTVPDTFWTALRSGSLQDGSLARFLLFRSTEDIPDRNRTATALSTVPADLVEALQSIAAGVVRPNRGNLVGTDAPTVIPDPHTVPMALEAQQLFDALDEELTQRQRQAIGSNHGAVLARIWENTAKVALIKAVSADPVHPIIRLEDATWARDVVDHCVATLLTQANRHLAENDTERNHKRMLEVVRSAGAEGLTKNELVRRTQFLDKRQRDDVIATLIESGQIGTAVRSTATRPALIFRMVPE
ncbi:MAG: PriCT-2 domain-containing protein [Defluviicoccus sp.]|nr:PriCT-2 domain-containing protein [Defluviicoccus sp.]MDG4591506.1 PriCT-2 domain-containing protein [Defluviicoccus sp.]